VANERRRGGRELSAFVVMAVAALFLLAVALALEIFHQYVEWPLGAGDWEIAEVIALASSISALSIFSLGTWRRLVRDTTERNRAEDELRASEKRLGHLLSANPAVIFAYTPSGQLTFMSGSVTSQLGYEAWQFVNDPMFWTDHIHPEDRHGAIGALSPLIRARA